MDKRLRELERQFAIGDLPFEIIKSYRLRSDLCALCSFEGCECVGRKVLIENNRNTVGPYGEVYHSPYEGWIRNVTPTGVCVVVPIERRINHYNHNEIIATESLYSTIYNFAHEDIVGYPDKIDIPTQEITLTPSSPFVIGTGLPSNHLVFDGTNWITARTSVPSYGQDYGQDNSASGVLFNQGIRIGTRELAAPSGDFSVGIRRSNVGVLRISGGNPGGTLNLFESR